jgi:hypothetical protein
MTRRKGKGAPRATAPAATPEPAIYYKTPVTPEEAFQAIGRLRKEANGGGPGVRLRKVQR